MPDTVTTKYGLVKPEIDGSPDTWGNKLNADMDIIDGVLDSLDPRDKADKATLVTDDFLAVFDSAVAGTPATKKKWATLFDNFFATARSIAGAITFAAQKTLWSFNGDIIKEHTNGVVKYFKKSGAGSYSWSKTDDGLSGGAGLAALMTLFDSGGLTIAGSFFAGPTIKATGVSAQLLLVPSSGNGLVYWYDPSGTAARMIMYTASAAQGSGFLQVGPNASGLFEFNTSGQFKAKGAVFAGAAFLNTDGNLGGTIWNNWGASDAFNAISARVEARAAAYTNNCVQSSRMAGHIVVQMNMGGDDNGTDINNSAYVIVRMWKYTGFRVQIESRQPQLWIPNVGWFAAFPW